MCTFPATCLGSAKCRCFETQMKNARLRTARCCLYIHSLVGHIWCFPVGKVTGCSKLTHRTHTNGHTLFRADSHRSDPSLHPFGYSNCLTLCIRACCNAFQFRSFRLRLNQDSRLLNERQILHFKVGNLAVQRNRHKLQAPAADKLLHCTVSTSHITWRQGEVRF
jgi:hypothetical protein